MKLLGILLLVVCAVSAEINVPTIELHDQFDKPQKLCFPAERVTVLTIADRKGSDQIDDWITALKPRFGGRVEFRGIAQVGGVPSLLQGHIRRKFQEARKYPVMMDWSGDVCKQLGAKGAVANVLLVDRKGTVLQRFEGRVNSNVIQQASAVLDKALAGHE